MILVRLITKKMNESASVLFNIDKGFSRNKNEHFFCLLLFRSEIPVRILSKNVRKPF